MILPFLIISIIINLIKNQKQKEIYKCGVDTFIFNDIIEIDPKPIDHNSLLYRRRLKDVDEDGFKDFNIYIDMTNLKKEIELYKIQNYSGLFINSINKAKETLQKLLKVKSLEIDFNLNDDDIRDNIGIDYWDEEKFGTKAMGKGINMFYLGIDLVIFAKFEKMDDDILASSSAVIMNSITGHPIVGVVYINKNIDFSIKNSQEYFQSIILHEFTHILGFNKYHFYYYLNIIEEKDNIFFINSTKVVQVAQKYFNCSHIDGIPLEDYGSFGTVGSHWEARVLLGDYMNGIIYPEEQVISEFTLALLEDTGYYKANYYTGGLMRYGKNKGCDFLNKACVDNSTKQINPYFENEFYDSIHADYEIDNSCSSGRQSRTYNAFWNRSYFYNPYNSPFNGWPSADFCPVPESYSLENKINYYVGHCSNKGSGEYGMFIQSTKDSTYNTSAQMKLITGETYSDHSFCYLSSLINKGKNLNHKYSKDVRAVCFETFCSSKSLTVKINNDYFVCPREGGKIEIEEYDGFFLCPDYNLICSGTVLCNDMFDCVDKKSKVKEESYLYDYEIKTTQNIDRAEEDNVNNKTNYELSDEGKCPKYCSQCKENKICSKCTDGYFRAKKEENILCLSKKDLEEGYFLYNSIYYECLENCKKCTNKNICEECRFGFTKNNNKCIGKIENCEEYIDINTCKKCKKQFAFKENERKNCTNITQLGEYYSKDGGISFFLCDGKGEEHIQNCNKCNYNENKLKCNECKNGFILLDEEKNKCYSKNIINDSNKTFYYINNTHARTCSKEIKNCLLCESDNKCIKCENNFYFLNDIKSKCYNGSEIKIKEYYLSKDNSTYYSCKNLKYNSFPNCKECSGNNTCSLCNFGYYFFNGNKTQCIYLNPLEANKYYVDPKDKSNLKKCSDYNQKCIECEYNYLYNDFYCFLCAENYGLFYYSYKCFLLSEYYDNIKEYNMYLLKTEFSYNYLYFYIFFDFEFPDDFYLTLPLKYISNSSEIDVTLYMWDYNEENKIGAFYGNMPYTIEYLSEIEINWKDIKDNKNKSINYTINTDYSDYFENLDFLDLYGTLNFTELKIYGVTGITKGNYFNLTLNKKISIEKKIKIKFMEYDNKSNVIEADCLLSKNSNYNLPCTIIGKENKKYIMKDYFYIDKNEDQLISISMKNPSQNYLMIESNLDDLDNLNIFNKTSTSNSGKKISGGIIAIIIVGGLLFVAIIITIVIIIFKKKEKKEANKYREKSMSDNSKNPLPFNTESSSIP